MEGQEGTPHLLKERLPRPEKICFVTAIDYPGWLAGGEGTEAEIRGTLALQTFRNFTEQGCSSVVVYSRRTSKPFLESLELYGYETLPHDKKAENKKYRLIEEEQKGLGEARRQGLLEALKNPDVEFIVMTEPEKVSVSDPETLWKLIEPVLDGEADMTIPDRGIKVDLKKKNPSKPEQGEDLRGYPPYQAYSETRFNNLVQRNILVAEGYRKEDAPTIDLIGGTRVFSKDLAKLFLVDWKVREGYAKTFDSHKGKLSSVDPRNYLSFYAPVILALSLGKKVISVPITYEHPPQQTHFEKGSMDYQKKRQEQLHGIASELAEVARFVKEVKQQGINLSEILSGKVNVSEVNLSEKVRLVPEIKTS